MIWAVLIGNTRTVAALMVKTKVMKRIVVPTQRLYTRAGSQSWARALRRASGAEGIIVASVVPLVDWAVRTFLQKFFGRKPVFVSAGGKLGIAVSVKKPSQVGADRLANAVAARKMLGAPVIVVDYGTGTTFDVVDAKGAYCGGAILPGLGISLRALHDFTAKIPLVKFERAKIAIGRTTEEAVRSGIYHGAIGTTRELLLKIRKELGEDAPAIATGGWCGAFKDSRLFKRIEPDLTLRGLSIIWNETHQRNFHREEIINKGLR